MPDLRFILIFDQNDVFDHFLIFTSIFTFFFLLFSEKHYFVITTDTWKE